MSNDIHLDDIIRTANQLGAFDTAALFHSLVQNKEMFGLAPVFDDIGLQLEQYLLLEHHLLPKAKPRPEENTRFKAIFGTRMTPLTMH